MADLLREFDVGSSVLFNPNRADEEIERARRIINDPNHRDPGQVPTALPDAPTAPASATPPSSPVGAPPPRRATAAEEEQYRQRTERGLEEIRRADAERAAKFEAEQARVSGPQGAEGQQQLPQANIDRQRLYQDRSAARSAVDTSTGPREPTTNTTYVGAISPEWRQRIESGLGQVDPALANKIRVGLAADARALGPNAAPLSNADWDAVKDLSRNIESAGMTNDASTISKMQIDGNRGLSAALAKPISVGEFKPLDPNMQIQVLNIVSAAQNGKPDKNINEAIDKILKDLKGNKANPSANELRGMVELSADVARLTDLAGKGNTVVAQFGKTTAEQVDRSLRAGNGEERWDATVAAARQPAAAVKPEAAPLLLPQGRGDSRPSLRGNMPAQATAAPKPADAKPSADVTPKAPPPKRPAIGGLGLH